MQQKKLYLTSEVALDCGVTKRTLGLWIRKAKISAPPRDGNGWWVWTTKHRQEALNYAASRAFSGSAIRRIRAAATKQKPS